MMKYLVAGAVILALAQLLQGTPLGTADDDAVHPDFIRAMRKRRSVALEMARPHHLADSTPYNVGEAGTSLEKNCETDYEIPVAVHVIHYTDGSRNVDRATVDKQMQVLQSGFETSMFQFKLDSVEWIADDDWVDDCQNEVKRAKYAKDTTRILNIYICPLYDSDFLYGITKHPWISPESDPTHGVIIDTDSLPGGTGPGLNQGKNLILEVGYYFGLFWIFEGNCGVQGDMVEDTPAQTEVYGCPKKGVIDTCPNKPGTDLVNNFMGFTTDACKDSFTEGQIQRMNAIFLKHKPTMVKYSGLKPCGLDGLFRWEDGHIYMFAGDKYYKYSEVSRRFPMGYPKRISSFWKGVPNDIDDVTRTANGQSYFIKGGQIYSFASGSNQVAAGYPRKLDAALLGSKVTFSYVDGMQYFLTGDHYYKFNISNNKVVEYKPIDETFKGLPAQVDTAIAWYNGDVYFFKGQYYYKWRPGKDSVVKETIDEWWKKEIGDLTNYTALWHCNGLTYFFRENLYWRFNDQQFQVSVGYPRNTSDHWTGVPDSVDDGFLWSDGNTYFFKGATYYQYDADNHRVAKSDDISALWHGVPNDIDAVFTYCNERTYFFKGSEYYRFNDTSLQVDAGYPKPISSFWKGVPNDVTSAFRWSNGMTYFFKEDKYYRFNQTSEQVDAGYPKPLSNWKGVVLYDM